MRTILGVLVSTLLVAGCAGATGSAAPAASSAAPSSQAPAASSAAPSTGSSASPSAAGSPSSSGGFGGTVTFMVDGAPATTTVDAVADGTDVSGTAVTTFREGIHTVKLGCVAKSGGGWVLGGIVEKTTVHGESPGAWSAVIVKDGTPQLISIWLSGDHEDASDCGAWVAAINPADLDPSAFSAIESGALVPPA